MDSTRPGSAEVRRPDPINALLLDDSAFDRRRIRRISDSIGLPIAIEEVPSLNELPAAMDRTDFDVMLIDYRLSDGDGFSAVELAGAHARNRHAAKIMISGAGQMGVAISALKMGCQDYLAKEEISPESLRAAIIQAMQRTSRTAAPLRELESEAERALIAALQSPGFMRNHQPAIADALHAAAQSFPPRRAPASRELESFLREFDSADNFAFRRASPGE